MPAISTNKLRVTNVDFFKDHVGNNPTYIFIGKTSQWNADDTPPSIADSTVDHYTAFEEIVGLKRIISTNVHSVLPRRDWVEGAVYDEYSDKVNIIDGKNPETNDFYKFYVITSEFNVYKCISNNNRAQSTVMPTGNSVNVFQTPDGYLWKYMYTVKTSDAFEFMTPLWIPCYTLYANDDSSQWLVQQAAVSGTIDHVVVTNSGANYDPNNPPTVEITGDGTGASAVAVINDLNNTIDKILIVDSGSGYTSATVTITDATGVGGEAEAVISPIGGHGHDARAELGATYAMIRVPLEGDESGLFPTNISYRRAGVLSRPESTDVGVAVYAAGAVGLYQVGETLTGLGSGATGVIRYIDQFRNMIYLESVTGQYTVGERISSQSYNETTVEQLFEGINLPLVATVAASTDYVDRSGELLYVLTRSKVTRDDKQTEEVRFIVSF